MTSSPRPAEGRPPAVAALDVAALQARIPIRADADDLVVRLRAACRAAGRAARALVQADGGRRRRRATRRVSACGDSRSACRPRRRGSCAPSSTRVQRRFRDKVTIALESHVARLQATIATIAHQEVPEYLDRLAMLRNQVFVLDHMYMAVFSTAGGFSASSSRSRCSCRSIPRSRSLAVFALPTVFTSTWRPGVERVGAGTRRAVQPTGASSLRHGDHGTAGKEVRLTGIGDRLARDRRSARGSSGHRPIAAARWGSMTWHAVAWAIFGAAYVGLGRLRVRRAARARPARCCSCSPPVRGCQRTSAPRSARSDSCAASGCTARDAWRGSRTTRRRSPRRPICRRPSDSRRGIRFEHVSFAYPGTDRLVLDDVTLDASGRLRRRGRRRERRGQEHAREAAGEDVRADVRQHPRSTTCP